MPTQLPIERQRYGHNVSDRLAVSTAPPFLLLWPEINHKYPPHHPCGLMAQPHQTPSGSEKRGTLPLPSRHTQVKASYWTHTYQSPWCNNAKEFSGAALGRTQVWWSLLLSVARDEEIVCSYSKNKLLSGKLLLLRLKKSRPAQGCILQS